MRYGKLLRRITLVTGALALLMVMGMVGILAQRRYRSETWGAKPLGELEREGSQIERVATHAVADSLRAHAARGIFPATEWAAIRTHSANDDTILFRIYRREDTRLLSPVFDPWIVGGAAYFVPEHRLLRAGVGVN